jgi:hypothetical protein
MKNSYRIILLLVSIVILLTATMCSEDYLKIPQKGVLTLDNMTNPEDIEGFVIAAYGFPNKQNFYYTNLPHYYGSVRSDDAYKGGGGGLNDQIGWMQMELFSLCTPNINNFDFTWIGGYNGIARTNTALRQLNNISTENFPMKEQRIAEMRFLRGYEYFQLKTFFRWIPYIDENLPANEYQAQSNRPDGMTDLDLWQKILDDFTAAYEVLPATQQEVGRPTKYAAEAFMVKTLMWMAYELDANNQLTNINQARLTEALQHCNNIITSAKYDLCDDFGHNFMCEYDNNTPESIWELQCTIDDGTNGMALNRGLTLNTPTWNPWYRCCDFHKMSYNYVNSCRTNADGLPLFDDFNEAELKNNSAYFADNTFDVRLSHTAGIPGSPWKYNPDILYDSAGTVHGALYGYIHSMKEQNDPTNACQWQNRFNSMNVRVIRYSEVLLWKAEALIQLNREDEALPIINSLRERAANSTEMLKFHDGTLPLNYNVQPYVDGVNCVWSNAYAWQALMWETRMEFAGEGRRFFDLVRWGVAEEVMNDFLTKEKTRLAWMSPGQFTAGRDEFLPIPSPEMVWSKGLFVQNPGY